MYNILEVSLSLYVPRPKHISGRSEVYLWTKLIDGVIIYQKTWKTEELQLVRSLAALLYFVQFIVVTGSEISTSLKSQTRGCPPAA